MTTTLTRPGPSRQASGRWGWPHYLAVFAIPILMLEAWTLTAWLADGPHQITEFRDTSSFSWYLARFYEGLSLLVAVVMAVYVVRGCRRARTWLTFDSMFVLCGLTIFWLDVGCNFFQPVFLGSSNWVNLNNACGHLPFVVNPDCGRVPDMLLFSIPLESFGVLALAVGLGAVVGRIRRRWPDISTPKLLGILLLAALVVDLAVEVPIIASGLWTYTGGPGIPLGGGFRYALLEFVGGPAVFAIALLRVFKDDHGRTFLERNLEQVKPGRRKLVTLLAMYTCFQLIGDGLGNAVILSGPYSPQWKKMPAHVVNDVCDAPGITGTRYGPCPGSPGYRMLVRSL